MTRAEGFAAIPNWMFREQGLSIHAVMVYGALASRAGLGGIYPSRATVAKEARCSLRKVADALNELEAVGVVERVRRRSKTGQASSGYRLIPQGHLLPDEQGAHDASTYEEGALDALGGGTSEHAAPLIEVEPLEVDGARPGFAEFYLAYPRKVGKDDARRAFEKAAKSTDPGVIVEGARRLAADPNLPEKRFIPHPATWLRRGSWDDEPYPAVPSTSGAPAPVEVEGWEWAAR